jgi:hypothetical protein
VDQGRRHDSCKDQPLQRSVRETTLASCRVASRRRPSRLQTLRKAALRRAPTTLRGRSRRPRAAVCLCYHPGSVPVRG